jgi:phage protein D
MKPKFKITADNSDITELLQGRLMSLSITDEIGLVSDTLTIEIDNRDNALAIPPRGATLEVHIGYDDLYPMGKFIADECEIKSPPDTLSITARASDSTMRDPGAYLSPRSESWEKKTISGIVKNIADRYGLHASIAPDFASIMVSHTDQTDESDCAFLSRLAEDVGASVKVANGQLLFIAPMSGKFPDGTLIPAITIKGSDITSYRMRLAERGKYGKVVAKYYDFDAAEEREVSVGASAPIFTLRETFTTAAQARARASAKLRECDTGTKTLSLEMVGNPLLSAESKISLTEVTDAIAGEWIVTSARHSLSSGGFKTSIEASKPKA